MTERKSRPGGGQDARKKIVAAGGRQISITLDADHAAALTRLVDHHGTNMAAEIKRLIRTADQAANYKK